MSKAQLKREGEGDFYWDPKFNCARIDLGDEKERLTAMRGFPEASVSPPAAAARAGSALSTLRERVRDFVLLARRAGSRVTVTSRPELRDQPINPDHIEEGRPRARCAVNLSASDGSIFSGEWDCTAGRFRWVYDDDEMIHILEGQAFIEVDGRMRSVGPGDSVFFPLGQTVRWHVPHYVRKVFFVRHPNKIVQALTVL